MKMDLTDVMDLAENGIGFNFQNCTRNAALCKKGFKPPTARKTGTTIVGMVFKDGVVLGADTRATEGDIIADKNCEKIHYIAPNMYCCGAGTAADTEMTTRMVSSNLELLSLSLGGRPARVVAGAQILKQFLFKYQGHIGAALILGGVDWTGPHLYYIHPHGATATLPYVTMGSGSLAAVAVFETGYKPGMEVEEAKQLVRSAIHGGIFNDLGSGSNVDLCVITKDKVDYLRTYDEANVKGKRQGMYQYKPGTTAVLSKQVRKIEYEIVKEKVRKPTDGEEKMDST